MAILDNIKASWSLDESSGNAIDASGNGFTLTNNGTVTYSTGKINNGAVFNNTTGKNLDYNGNLGFNGLTGTRTWMAWVNVSSFSATGYILDNTTTTGADRRFILYSESDSKIHMYAGTNEVLTPALSTSTWYHIVVTQNGTTWELFLNGSSQGTTTMGTATFGDNSFRIGESYAGGGAGKSTNDIVTIWDRVLNLTEIRQLYNNGTGQQYPFASTPIVFSEIISAVGSASGSTTISNTSTHAVGNNLIGLVFIEQGTIASGDPTGVTWGGNAMTKISTFTTGTARQTLISLWGILSPLTGSRTITATFSVASNSNILWATYGGVSQSTAIGSLQQATNGTAGATTNTAFITTALTPAIANSWVVSMGIDLASGFTETAGTTKRYWANWSILDTGGPVSVSTTLGGTLGSSACWGNNAVVLPAIVTSTPTNASFLLSMI